MLRKQKMRGFTLLELLIVVAIISIVASLAVANLQSSKKAAFEVAAIAYLRTWTAGQELYRERYGYYADSDQQLISEELIGNPDPDAHGYTFSIDNAARSKYRWWGQGWPTEQGVTGDRSFFIDSSGVIRYSKNGRANENSPPLGG
ncbi:MAG: type II secretion system protein [Acidobacteriota bacterium]|nr:MAG: type II secretion system protein [Acidobacteriota bacterium]